MASPESTIRALAEAILPSPPDDDTAGAGDVAAERFVVHYLSFLKPGLPDVLAAALDGLAAARASAPFEAGLFEALPPDERLSVLRALGEHDLADLRDLADLSVALVLASFYGEWTAQPDGGGPSVTPVGWELTGYRGPVAAVQSLLAGAGSGSGSGSGAGSGAGAPPAESPPDTARRKRRRR